MRKFLTIPAAALCAALLCGCAGEMPFSAKKPDLGKSWSMSAGIKCGKLEAEAEVRRLGEKDWEFAFTEPRELCGITMKINADGVSASLGGLSFTAPESSEFALVPEIISAAIDTLASVPDEKISSADGVMTLETQFGDSSVIITANEATGLPVSLKCPNYGLAVNFLPSGS